MRGPWCALGLEEVPPLLPWEKVSVTGRNRRSELAVCVNVSGGVGLCGGPRRWPGASAGAGPRTLRGDFGGQEGLRRDPLRPPGQPSRCRLVRKVSCDGNLAFSFAIICLGTVRIKLGDTVQTALEKVSFSELGNQFLSAPHPRPP